MARGKRRLESLSAPAVRLAPVGVAIRAERQAALREIGAGWRLIREAMACLANGYLRLFLTAHRFREQ